MPPEWYLAAVVTIFVGYWMVLAMRGKGPWQ